MIRPMCMLLHPRDRGAVGESERLWFVGSANAPVSVTEQPLEAVTAGQLRRAPRVIADKPYWPSPEGCAEAGVSESVTEQP